jgi:hypothetical protein
MTGFVPPKNTPDKDIVMTPPSLAIDIINHFAPTGKILDPCRGEGAFYNNFPGTNNEWCELSEGKDFFDFNQKVDWIITNPPWSKIRDFVEHGMSISDNMVYLITINHLTTKRRIRDIIQGGWAMKEIYCVETPPKPWPSLGFQVAAIHLQKGYDGKISFGWQESLF